MTITHNNFSISLSLSCDPSRFKHSTHKAIKIMLIGSLTLYFYLLIIVMVIFRIDIVSILEIEEINKRKEKRTRIT